MKRLLIPTMALPVALIVALAALMMGPNVMADRANECSRLWQLEKDAGCPVMPPENSVDAYPDRQDFLISSDFGPSKCVIEENLGKEKDILKNECREWVKERKADLGNKFLTSTCNPECSPCPGNSVLRHCTSRGEVHYSVK